MTTVNARPNARGGGKAFFVQSRGGKGKWGVSSPGGSQSGGQSPAGSVPQSPALAPAKLPETVVNDVDAKHMHDRMLFLLMNLIGMHVEVTVKNGSKFEGLFHTASTEGELGVVLRLARCTSGKDKKDSSPVINSMIILAKECMAISATGVDFSLQDRGASDRGDRDSFKTDTDISRSGDIRERDLQKWTPEEHTSIGGIEDDMKDGHTNWDQFAANEKLFGVRTEFDEELYTTRLDRSGADFKARERQAIQIANEIQQSSSNNIHMQEERGHDLVDSGMDEEDRYGAVVRDPTPIKSSLAPSTNKYMPPGARRQMQMQTPPQHYQQVVPTPALSQPQQRQSPVLSQKENPPVGAAASAAANTGLAPTPVPAPATAAPSTPVVSAAKAQLAQRVVEPEFPPIKPADIKPMPLPRSSIKPLPAHALNELRTNNPVAILYNQATIKGAENKTIPENALHSNQIEETIRQFALSEREVVQTQKAQMALKKNELVKKEKEQAKNGLTTQLKQFGKSFTLSTPVPEDLKEIISKGKKPETAAGSVAALATTSTVSTTSKPVEAPAEKPEPIAEASVTKPGPSAQASKPAAEPVSKEKVVDKPASSETAAPASSFKFNVKASVFKPNVNATPFTPAGISTERKVDKAAQFFGRPVKKGPVALQDTMAAPFKNGQTTPPATSIAPTWPYGHRSFRLIFQNSYDDDMYNASQGGPGYYPMGQYRYGGPPPNIMGPVPYMTPVPMPYQQPISHPGAAPVYPPMSAVSAPHFTQGFAASHQMIPPNGMHMAPMYPYPPAHGGPVMMRYPPEMVPHVGPNNGMVMHGRPLSMDPHGMHYPPGAEGSSAPPPPPPPPQELSSDPSHNVEGR